MIFVQLPIKIQVFYTPELARPLQMTVCTLTFAKHTIVLGPERVYCRRQLRSAPGRGFPPAPRACWAWETVLGVPFQFFFFFVGFPAGCSPGRKPFSQQNRH